MRTRGWRLAAATTLALAAASVAVAQARPTLPIYKDARQPVDRRVDDLLARMTLDEKVAQLETIWEQKSKVQTADGRFSPEAASQAFPNGIGGMARPSDKRGVVASNGAAGASAAVNRDARDTADYVNAAQHWAVEHTRLGIPILMHEESLHGYVARGATSFPQAIALASSWDPELVTRVFSVAAREMRARGAFLALAPVVDIARDPRWGRIEETYGEDPYLVGTIGLAAIRGFQGPSLPLGPDKVLVTLKHFTGHGQPESGTNVGPAHLGERELREDFFPPFEARGEDLPDPVRNGVLQRDRRHPVARQQLASEPGPARRMGLPGRGRQRLLRHPRADDSPQALRQHHRRCRPGRSSRAWTSKPPTPKALLNCRHSSASGRVPQALVDQAVRRVLRLKIESGLFDNPFPDPATAEAKTATPDAIALAREAADKAIVLLKNDHGLLPLEPAKIHRMAVIGAHARDTPIGGYSDVPKHVVSVLEGMQEAGKGRFAVDYSEGVRLTETRCWSCDEVKLVPASVNRKLIAQAVQAARKADTIVMVLGGNEQTSREAWADTHLGDRSSLDLVGQQQDLARAILALHKPTVIVLLNGRPLSVNYLAAKAPALVEGWYLGQETGHAVADVLFGKVNPGGKLPVSIPRSVGQLPVYYDHKPTSRRGYLFDTTEPLYPFGYGLSYTSFAISAPRILTPAIAANESARIEVDVANTGSRAGDEVVQLYIHDDQASVTRPVIELKRFQRVSLRPGERRTIAFTLDPDDLALWNPDMKHVVEPGTFTISAGPNSVDLKSAKLTVTD